MATSIGNVGARLDLLIRQGGSFLARITLTDPVGGLPINLTGATLRGQIRKRASSALAAEFTVLYIDRPNGIVDIQLTAVQTAAISAADDPASKDNVYAWDLEMDMAGFVTPLAWGEAKMHREVTR